MIPAFLVHAICVVASQIYPAYYSFKAIKGRDLSGCKRWLQYWIVFGLFSTVELFADVLVFWLPFYYETKLLFLVWLVSPWTKGSDYFYRHFVHPMLAQHEDQVDTAVEQAFAEARRLSLTARDKALTSVRQALSQAVSQGQYNMLAQVGGAIMAGDVNPEPLHGSPQIDLPPCPDLTNQHAQSQPHRAASNQNNPRHNQRATHPHPPTPDYEEAWPSDDGSQSDECEERGGGSKNRPSGYGNGTAKGMRYDVPGQRVVRGQGGQDEGEWDDPAYTPPRKSRKKKLQPQDEQEIDQSSTGFDDEDRPRTRAAARKGASGSQQDLANDARAQQTRRRATNRQEEEAPPQRPINESSRNYFSRPPYADGPPSANEISNQSITRAQQGGRGGGEGGSPTESDAARGQMSSGGPWGLGGVGAAVGGWVGRWWGPASQPQPQAAS